jgi:hypothetical protein
MRTAIATFCLLLATALSAEPARPACCHGCDMFTCNTQQCGKTCKMGPKCKNCWKDCGGGSHHTSKS